MDTTMNGTARMNGTATISGKSRAERELIYNRRRAEVRRKKAYLIVFLALIITTIIFICFNLTTADAAVSDEVSVEQHRYYTSINIEKDDTLWSIASQYVSGTNTTINYINDIMEINHLDSDLIYHGQNLIVYYYSTDVK